MVKLRLLCFVFCCMAGLVQGQESFALRKSVGLGSPPAQSVDGVGVLSGIPVNRKIAVPGSPSGGDMGTDSAGLMPPAAGLQVIKTENLYTYDGQPGYSLGQGE